MTAKTTTEPATTTTHEFAGLCYCIICGKPRAHTAHK